jgi:DNA polymerase-3 subunit epsilon
VVDIETTGKNPQRDAILQFCGVPFEYAPATGQVYRMDKAVLFLEDPRRPIPSEITALTGLTDQDVAGKRIEDEVVHALLGDVALVIAHNAGFDRRFLERRLPAFRDRPWACSLAEAPWQGEGFSSSALEFLLYKKCGMFMDAHRADEDCHLRQTCDASRAPLMA